ncbi:diguanylate cyclase (GGDEF) domain protein [Bacteriovorax sp. BSW11_IV]|uniref:GGDEF domain-containing protein n=1 Tax=Bacteriovorax sp. BSW11_IV TaxID=1353529 RepID=UPI00038A1565|nr:GGDEF domain-containing protein [Bacteriovorax sp. BSW11_IV]EQC45023.1 diguanylate cyclase (GGDEF) domain protein [Bacteriovorax sp. BSW11_IV]
MSIEELSKDYKKLLDFVCTSDDVDTVKKLFELFDGFFQTEYFCSPMLVYSVSIERKVRPKDLKKHFRSFWNKEKEAIFYDSAEIQPLLEKVWDSYDKKWFVDQNNDLQYYVIKCGNTEKQEYFGIFKSSKSINPIVLDYLSQYLETTFVKLNRYSEVSELKNLVHIDDVTGLYNQRKFSLDIDESIKRYEDVNESFSVVFIDIDHFKDVNDGHGHLVGTSLLQEVAKIIKDCTRDEDLCYRYGGDEFVLIIPNSTLTISRIVGERILGAIANKEFKVNEEGHKGEGTFRLTVSVGIANFPENANSRTQIISIADRMMYAAKKSGRGKVCAANDLVSEE